MALEAIREIVGGFGDGDEGLVGRLLMIDAQGDALRDAALRLGPRQPAERNGVDGAELAKDRAVMFTSRVRV